MILKKEIISELSKKLSLPFTGTEQDWDIEMADSNRINEFLNFYNQRNLSSEEKFAVMSLIVSSYEDFLNEQNIEDDDRWNEIKSILKSEKKLFDSLIYYWTGNETENIFRITPLMGEIKETE